MKAALTILIDSFRLLQAKKLFWIALGISMLVALLYASIGFDSKGVTVGFGWKQIENSLLRAGQPEAQAFYILLFTDVIVKFWLAFFAIFLALLSTASIFPDFMAEGSIGVSLAKPLSRLRLFLLKYAGCMLFVALQMTLFTIIVFLALGLRFGQWNFTVFWAVPVVTFVFSLLYAWAVLIGVWTRSTLFALLGGMLMWGCTLLAQWTEDGLYKMAYTIPEMGMRVDVKTGQVKENGADDPAEGLKKAHGVAESVLLPLPKTRECTQYLKRLIRLEQKDSMLTGVDLGMLLSGQVSDDHMGRTLKKTEERHSVWYVFGTSIAFEVVVLALAAWIFCRRDY